MTLRSVLRRRATRRDPATAARPKSSFHFSLGISYPNAADVARARAAGTDPGGDIFIHGWSPAARLRGADWTWGCIAVRNHEIEQIYAMVGTGTPISIYR